MNPRRKTRDTRRLFGSAARQHAWMNSSLPTVYGVLAGSDRALRPHEIAAALANAGQSVGDWHAISRRCWRLVELGDARRVELPRGYAFEAVRR